MVIAKLSGVESMNYVYSLGLDTEFILAKMDQRLSFCSVVEIKALRIVTLQRLNLIGRSI